MNKFAKAATLAVAMAVSAGLMSMAGATDVMAQTANPCAPKVSNPCAPKATTRAAKPMKAKTTAANPCAAKAANLCAVTKK